MDPQTPLDELVCLWSGSGAFRAEIARDLLSDAGIETSVFDAASYRMLHAVPVRLMLRARDVHRALDVLRDLELAPHN